MYRQFKNPWTLEDGLEALKARIADTTDEDELMYLYEEKAELEDRVRFAWADQEYDEDHAEY